MPNTKESNTRAVTVRFIVEDTDLEAMNALLKYAEKLKELTEGFTPYYVEIDECFIDPIREPFDTDLG